jgi:hypothetical protein
VIAVSLVVAGCSILGELNVGGLSSDYDIHIENGTELDLGILVNASVVAQVPAGTGDVVEAGGLGALPWTIVAMTPTGRWLASMRVEPDSVGCTDGPDGSRACSGSVSLTDLSCGRLLLYVTPTPPEIPAPMPGGGEPGDCDP